MGTKQWNYKQSGLPDPNVVSINAARYTLIQRNGKPVHANKREIVKLCRAEGVSEITDRATKEIIKVNLATGKFEVA